MSSCCVGTIGADKTALPQRPGNPLRSSQRNGSVHAAGIGPRRERTGLVWLLRPVVNRPSGGSHWCMQGRVRGWAHSTDGGGGGVRWGHQQHMIVPPLPVVRPAPVAAAAGESPTASAPLPAVYGYTPEQRVGTERQESGKLSSRRQMGRGGGADRDREVCRDDKSRRTHLSCVTKER